MEAVGSLDWPYSGPKLTIDAATRRNELAFANDALGAFDDKGASRQVNIASEMSHVMTCRLGAFTCCI